MTLGYSHVSMMLKNVTNSKLILILFYDWDHVNNMLFNYISFNGSMTPCGSNVYTNPDICRVTAP